MPTKKGKLALDGKGKGTTSPTEENKKSLAKAKTSSSKAATRAGTSANPSIVLGHRAFILKNPVVVEKLIEGVIPPLDTLELHRSISRLFQEIGVN